MTAANESAALGPLNGLLCIARCAHSRSEVGVARGIVERNPGDMVSGMKRGETVEENQLRMTR